MNDTQFAINLVFGPGGVFLTTLVIIAFVIVVAIVCNK